MFVEMMLALFALVIAGTIYASSSEYGAALAKGPWGCFCGGCFKIPWGNRTASRCREILW